MSKGIFQPPAKGPVPPFEQLARAYAGEDAVKRNKKVIRAKHRHAVVQRWLQTLFLFVVVMAFSSAAILGVIKFGMWVFS